MRRSKEKKGEERKRLSIPQNQNIVNFLKVCVCTFYGRSQAKMWRIQTPKGLLVI